MTSSWPTLSPGGFGRCRRGSEQMTFHVPSSKHLKYQAFRAPRSTRPGGRAPEMSDRLPRNANLLVLQEDYHYIGEAEAYRSDSCVGRGVKSRQSCLIDPSAALTVFVLVEKVAPFGAEGGRLSGGLLIASGSVRLQPDLEGSVVRSSTPTLRRTLWRSGTDRSCRILHDGEAEGSVPSRWLPDGLKHARQAWRRVA